ncbi:MAG: hypothetical protein DME12_20865 [Candidatus Rokuibacteriota bacterium]|nr:MAG: hypothetical protein DME12_20865 [Candidatus Rokubacteria bacterium]PYM65288.1 MAG: hypothetical protein DME11_10885 [Candidatus Rokubacteria bacterium]PYN67614.1 MAG: hypothetical protein DMD93_13890 [Candidatus Rokubacteria bacterium]
MNVDRSYVGENDAQRERLRALVRRLTDQELGRPMSAGWTIAGVLGHLAFWDQRVLVLLERWERAGPSAVPPVLDHAAVDWINDAAKPLLLALLPRRAADLAVSIAEAVDRKVKALPDEFVVRNVAAGTPVNLLRAEHRREHLDEIERALRG